MKITNHISRLVAGAAVLVALGVASGTANAAPMKQLSAAQVATAATKYINQTIYANPLNPYRAGSTSCVIQVWPTKFLCAVTIVFRNMAPGTRTMHWAVTYAASVSYTPLPY